MYDSHPALNPSERAAWDAWAEVMKQRSRRWKQTEAWRMFKRLGMENTHYPIRVPMRLAFTRGEIDGTLDSLQAIVDGKRHIGGFGPISRQKLGSILIAWYRHQAREGR
jgi:hypothetical protein